MYNTVTRMLL